MKKTRIVALSVLAVAIVGSALYIHFRSPSKYVHPLTIGTTHIKVAYASTPSEQEQGLSGTRSLAGDQGMLFAFPTETELPFWMKGMHYSLDIIWIGSDMTVKDITPDLSPSTYPNSYGPKVPIQYTLEVPAGFAKAHEIVDGTQVSF